MATLKSRLEKLEDTQPMAKVSIIVFPWQTEGEVMREQGLSANDVGDVWTIEFVVPGDIPGCGAVKNLISG